MPCPELPQELVTQMCTKKWLVAACRNRTSRSWVPDVYLRSARHNFFHRNDKRASSPVRGRIATAAPPHGVLAAPGGSREPRRQV